MTTAIFEIGKTYNITREQPNGTHKVVGRVKVVARTATTVKFEGWRSQKLFASFVPGKGTCELAYPKLRSMTDNAKIRAFV